MYRQTGKFEWMKLYIKHDVIEFHLYAENNTCKE